MTHRFFSLALVLCVFVALLSTSTRAGVSDDMSAAQAAFAPARGVSTFRGEGAGGGRGDGVVGGAPGGAPPSAGHSGGADTRRRHGIALVLGRNTMSPSEPTCSTSSGSADCAEAGVRTAMSHDP